MTPRAAMLLYILASDERASSIDLADAMRVGRKAVQHHLNALQRHGLVESYLQHTQGKVGGHERHWTISPAGVARARAELAPA